MVLVMVCVEIVVTVSVIKRFESECEFTVLNSLKNGCFGGI